MMGWQRAEIERAKRMTADWKSARSAATKAIEGRLIASRLRKGLTTPEKLLKLETERGSHEALARR